MIAAHNFCPKTFCQSRRLFNVPQLGTARAIVAIGIALSLCATAQALIVGNVPNVVPQTTVNPASYSGWSNGDPGWNNVVAGGSNYVYLGDGWVLSARHVGYNATNGVTLQTMLPNGELGPVETFYRVPGNYYYDYGYFQGSTRYYAVSNPTTIQSETGQTVSLMDSRGTFFTDLQLFRINGDPGLPPLTIASEPLGSNFTRANAPEVVAVGRGVTRLPTETHWNTTELSQTDWTWQTTTGAGTHQGYFRDSSSAAKRWGTNRLADPRPNGPGDPADPGATSHTNLFEAVVSDTTAVLPLTTPDGATRDVISIMTVFDPQFDPKDPEKAPGSTPLEFQGIGGNSGSSVFYKRGDQWELAGIVNAIFTYPDQAYSTAASPDRPTNAAVYGNATLISDLSYYNQDYFNSIKYIIESHPNYSHIGDLNLDGTVSGDGTGPPGTDDVTDFVLGWQYDNGTGVGNITSWKNGDLNRDGKTNVNDFLMLRGALNGQISGAVVEALFGDASFNPASSVVPEPATAFLGCLAAAFFALAARRRPAVSSL